MSDSNSQYILDHFNVALEKGCIKAFFQPIVRTLTGSVCCAEALARWEDPERGLLSPADFIPVLEENRLIYRLDLEILRRACAMYRKLQETDRPLHSLSVNFSRLDFLRPDFLEAIVSTVDAFQVPHKAIKIEVTESLMVGDRAVYQKVFNTLHEAGFDIWIDDFGTGYSSISLLQEFDFEVIKIDMVFIRSFTPRSRQLIVSIVNMSKSLGILTLVEGVEREEQLSFLKTVGCEGIQGYYYAKPLDEDAFIAFLAANQVEKPKERDYWNAVGRFNLLSPNPMEDENGLSEIKSDIPLALIECTWGRGDYVFANEAYMDSIHSLGFDSIQALEQYFNDRISPRYNPMRNLLTEAVMKNTVQEIDYVSSDVFYRFKARCIAKSRELNKAMVVASLSTFKDGTGIRDKTDLMQYSQSLYASYEHVNLLFPEKSSSIRVFSKANFQTAHQLKGLREGIRSFCEKEVLPEDRARYLRFFDVDTLDERLGDRGYIQQGFRIHDINNRYVWRQIRITRVPSVMESMYLYTIQTMSDVSIRIAELLVNEHPEMLE